MNNSTNLKQVSGGKLIASGDITSDFSYELLDENFVKLTTSGEATLTLINKSDGLAYVKDVKQVTNGVMTFTIPALQQAVYQVFIEYQGGIYPSDGSVYLIVEKNPDDAVLNTVDPITIESYLLDYAKKTEIPDTTLLALKSELPDVSGLATETFVNEKINGISAPDLTGLATETYVDEKIEALPIQEPIDTSLFLTKPLSEPNLTTDPATKNYVDTAVANVSGGSSEEWTILKQGTTAKVDLLLDTWISGNQFKKVKLLYSFNSTGTAFDAYFNFGRRGTSSIYPKLNQTAEISTIIEYSPGNIPVSYKAANAIFEIDFQFVSSIYNLKISNIFRACKVDVKPTLDTFAIPLDAVSGAPIFNYTTNYSTIVSLDVYSNYAHFLISSAGTYNWTVLGSNS